MDSWRKETLGLEVGDTIIWRDEAIELEGQPVTPGMKGEVLSLHDGFHLDVAEVKPIPPSTTGAGSHANAWKLQRADRSASSSSGGPCH